MVSKQNVPSLLRNFFAGMPHNIRVFSVADLLGNFARSMVFPYLSLYILALGGTTAQIGLIQSLTPLFGLIMFPVGGYLADRTSRVRLIILSNMILITNVLIMAFSPNWQIYAVATALQGLAYFQFPARSALLADSLHPGQRGKGIATLNTISNSLAIMAPFVAGAVIAVYGDLRGVRMLLHSRDIARAAKITEGTGWRYRTGVHGQWRGQPLLGGICHGGSRTVISFVGPDLACRNDGTPGYVCARRIVGRPMG